MKQAGVTERGKVYLEREFVVHAACKGGLAVTRPLQQGLERGARNRQARLRGEAQNLPCHFDGLRGAEQIVSCGISSSGARYEAALKATEICFVVHGEWPRPVCLDNVGDRQLVGNGR